MKKSASIFVLLLVLSFTAVGNEGTTHTGGRSCPPNQTCLIEDAPDTADNPFKNLLAFIKKLFE